MLIGVVLKNGNNQYLLLKKQIEDQVDLGLIDFNSEENEVTASLQNIVKEKFGIELDENIQINTLFGGEDQDGEYLILQIETDLLNGIAKSNDGAEIVWSTFNKIKKLFKSEKLNRDQLSIFKRAEEGRLKNSTNAMKVSHLEEKRQKKLERNEFDFYVNKFSDKRLFLRLVWGRKVKPCGRECRDYGRLIANEFSDHSSFDNFPELMDDKEFLLEIARTSRNPATCRIYFYDYVNEYLKEDENFRLEFLKAIYLNENVFTLEDLNTIVEYCEMEEENKMILSDIKFRRLFEKRIEDLDLKQVEYHCSGDDEKELRKYKIKANELKVLVENMKRGLTEILNTFTVGKKVEKREDEPQTYYEYLLMEAKRNNLI